MVTRANASPVGVHLNADVTGNTAPVWCLVRADARQ